MLPYNEALGLWGAFKLNEQSKEWGEEKDHDPANVHVDFEFSAGYACCGGKDPGCYCSFAESPSSDVVIRDYSTNDSLRIDVSDFDFAKVLYEIVMCGGGQIEA